jgi:ribosomal protein L11 methyltransferase
MPAGDGWRQITFEVEPAELDALSGALWAAGVAGIEERPDAAGTILVVSAAVGVLDRVSVVLGDRPAVVREVAGDEGLDGWRDHAAATRVGPVVIQPAWQPEEGVAPGEFVVRIDPGRAFGSGSHVTTRLAAGMLVDHVRHGDRVLDLGTGSGVLSIIAAKLGAAHVLAVDLDARAREVARQNIARNEVQSVITVAEQVEGDVDLVVANITMPTLLELRDTVVATLAPDARVVLSGVLVSQADSLVAAYEGVRWLERRHEGEWVACAGRRED